MKLIEFIIFLCLIFYSSGVAQIKPDSRIRIYSSKPEYAGIIGTFIAIDNDSLELKLAHVDHPKMIPCSALSRLEKSYGRGLNYPRALEGAVVGLAVGLIALAPSIMSYGNISSAALFAGSTTLVAGAIGLGGRKSQRGAIYGLVMGFFLGGVVGEIIESKYPTERVWPAFGMAVGGVTGSLIGISIGLIHPGERWQKVSFDDFGYNFLPLLNKGFSINLSFDF